MADSNIELLAGVAEALGELRERFVFLGGCATALLIAFEDRGKGDYLESHDLEDVLSVVDGRPEIVDEIAQAEPELRRYVGKVFAGLVADEGFLNALPGLIIEGSPAARAPVVLQRLRTIAAMS
ncbi:MAG TPA: hypothetical protein VGC50_03310 [Gammaproteobacteria bacterium]